MLKILNSLHIDIFHNFHFKNLYFPNFKIISEKNEIVKLFNVWLNREYSWILTSASIFNCRNMLLWLKYKEKTYKGMYWTIEKYFYSLFSSLQINHSVISIIVFSLILDRHSKGDTFLKLKVIA